MPTTLCVKHDDMLVFQHLNMHTYMHEQPNPSEFMLLHYTAHNNMW